MEGQAFLYPAYLTDVHAGKGGFADGQIGKYQLVLLLVLNVERKDLPCNGQKRDDGFHIRFLPFDADFLRAIGIADDVLRFEPLHIHTCQSREGTEQEELPCPLELSVHDGRLENALQFLRGEITPCAVGQFRLVIYERVDADVLLLLTDADELPQKDDHNLNGGKGEVAI